MVWQIAAAVSLQGVMSPEQLPKSVGVASEQVPKEGVVSEQGPKEGVASEQGSKEGVVSEQVPPPRPED